QVTTFVGDDHLHESLAGLSIGEKNKDTVSTIDSHSPENDSHLDAPSHVNEPNANNATLQANDTDIKSNMNPIEGDSISTLADAIETMKLSSVTVPDQESAPPTSVTTSTEAIPPSSPSVADAEMEDDQVNSDKADGGSYVSSDYEEVCPGCCGCLHPYFPFGYPLPTYAYDEMLTMDEDKNDTSCSEDEEEEDDDESGTDSELDSDDTDEKMSSEASDDDPFEEQSTHVVTNEKRKGVTYSQFIQELKDNLPDVIHLLDSLGENEPPKKKQKHH
ncbi:hypothetical protein DM01DRAFT_1400297, partial [Hesseltinella vesiculosa]